jgi:hypothetical protein
MGKYASLIVLALLNAVLIVRLQTQKLIVENWDSTASTYDRLTVKNIANGGAALALQALTANVFETAAVTNMSLLNGKFSYKIERAAEDGTLGPTQIRITSIGAYNSLVDTVVVLLTRPSFSRYAYFTNMEGDIWFQTGDTIRGPAHTNEYFRMQGRPVFQGKVTSHLVYSSTNPYRKYDSSTNPDFQNGTEWKIPQLEVPTEIPVELVNASKNAGIYIKGYTNVYMKFVGDGTALIARTNSTTEPSAGAYTTYSVSTTNGVIYVENTTSSRPNVYVQGTSPGQVTVASSGNIKVTGNLLCADNPRTNEDSEDIIGLVAAKNIIVTKNVKDVDRTIQASIMTMNPTVSSTTNFNVENYSTIRYGYLHLYGALVQQARGAVGVLGSSSSRFGYLKDYRWDSRLQRIAPPFFPMLFVLRKISWWN